jgi:hypothetical protein
VCYYIVGGDEMGNIGFKEDLTHEFKSDKNKISDSDIIDAVVAFANTDGGELYIGIEDDGEITEFLSHIYAIVDSHVERYVRRGFSNLMMSFGCTGGQHRSVYSAEHVARHIAEKYPQVRVRLIHREQGIGETL